MRRHSVIFYVPLRIDMWQQILALVLTMFGVSAIAFNLQSTCDTKAGEPLIVTKKLEQKWTDFDLQTLQVTSFNNATEICSDLKELKSLSACASMTFDDKSITNLDSSLTILIDDFYCNKDVTMQSRDMRCLEESPIKYSMQCFYLRYQWIYNVGFKLHTLSEKADQLLTNCTADEIKFAWAVKTVASYGRNACGHGDVINSDDMMYLANRATSTVNSDVLIMLVVIKFFLSVFGRDK